MKASFYTVLAATCLAAGSLMAQTNTFPSSGKVGIGTTTPNASSLLEVKSTTKGVLIPRMTQAQRDAIASPATGLLIYQTDNNPGFFYYSGSTWTGIQQKGKTWSLTGNQGTTPGTNYLGTSDAKDLVFKTNAAERMRILKSGLVGIGTSSPIYPLEVEGGSTSTAIYGNTSGAYGVYGNGSTAGVYGSSGYYGVEGYAPGGVGYGYGVYGSSSYTGVSGSGGSYGVSGYCTSTSSGYGVYGSATTNASGIGVYGEGYYGVKAVSSTLYGIDGTGYYIGVIGHGSSSNSTSYGVEGYGNTGGSGGYFTGGSIGVQGYASSSSGTNYGVYGSTNSGSGYAGYFSGTVYATTYTGSDRKLKKNIEDVRTGMDIIKQLHPKTYEFRQDGSYQYMHLPEGKHYGLIAQDLEQVLPNLVKDTKFDTRMELQAQTKAKGNGEPETRKAAVQGEVIDFKAVNYTELIPIIIKGMQELSAQNDALKNENIDLQNQINELKAMIGNQSTSNGSTIVSSASLSQNVPNPFSNSTTISYSIPQQFSSAKMIITNRSGAALKTITIANNKGSVNINSVTLSSGAYQYSLYVDGKLIDTKQMILSK